MSKTQYATDGSFLERLKMRVPIKVVFLLQLIAGSAYAEQLVSTTFTWKFEDAPKMVGGDSNRTWYFWLTPGSGDWRSLGLMSSSYFSSEFGSPYLNLHEVNYGSHFSVLTPPYKFATLDADVNGTIRGDIATSGLHLPYAEWMNSPYSKAATGSHQLKNFTLRNIEIRMWHEGVNPALSMTFVGFGEYVVPEPATAMLLAIGAVLLPCRRRN